MSKGRIVEWHEMRDLTDDERTRVVKVECKCEHCDGPTSGISIGKMDGFGFVHPEATSVILDKLTNEWVVYVYDADSESSWNQREAARYPADEVEAIRYLPRETRNYGHHILMPEVP